MCIGDRVDAAGAPAISGWAGYSTLAVALQAGGFPAVACAVPPFCPATFFLNATGCWPCPAGAVCAGATSA